MKHHPRLRLQLSSYMSLYLAALCTLPVLIIKETIASFGDMQLAFSATVCVRKQCDIF